MLKWIVNPEEVLHKEKRPWAISNGYLVTQILCRKYNIFWVCPKTIYVLGVGDP
jgi:hypothetical protein